MKQTATSGPMEATKKPLRKMTHKSKTRKRKRERGEREPSGPKNNRVVLQRWDVLTQHTTLQTEGHYGNRFFRQQIENKRAYYQSLPKNSRLRSATISEIRDAVLKRGGRFLSPLHRNAGLSKGTACSCCNAQAKKTPPEKESVWMEVPRGHVREKIRKALARPDGGPEQRKLGFAETTTVVGGNTQGVRTSEAHVSEQGDMTSSRRGERPDPVGLGGHSVGVQDVHFPAVPPTIPNIVGMNSRESTFVLASQLMTRQPTQGGMRTNAVLLHGQSESKGQNTSVVAPVSVYSSVYNPLLKPTLTEATPQTIKTTNDINSHSHSHSHNNSNINSNSHNNSHSHSDDQFHDAEDGLDFDSFVFGCRARAVQETQHCQDVGNMICSRVWSARTGPGS